MAFRASTKVDYAYTGTAPSVAVPTGAAVDDIAILDLWLEHTATTITAVPTGFTLDVGPVNPAGGQTASGCLRRYWKRLTAADTGSYTFTLGASDNAMLVCTLWSGRITTGSPFDVTTVTDTGHPMVLSLTTVTAGCDLIATSGSWDNAFVPANIPAGYTNTPGGDYLGSWYRANVTAGAQNGAASPAVSDITDAAFSALKPAAGGGSAGNAVGVVSRMALSARNGTTSVLATGNAVGVPAVVSMQARDGVAAVPATAAGTRSTITLQARSGAASVNAAGNAVGSVAAFSLQARSGAATAPALVVGSLATMALQARSGSVSASSFRYPTTVHASGRYFLDQTGTPYLMDGDSPWGIVYAQPWSGTDSQKQYIDTRIAQGFNTMLITAVGSSANGLTKGQTYDGVFPFTGTVGTPNSTYWARMDQLLGYLRDNGITAVVYPVDRWTMDSGEWFEPSTVNNAACQAYGAFIANRYPAATYPNILWAGGGDFSDAYDSELVRVHKQVMVGVRSTGDTRPYTIQFYNHSHSTQDGSTGDWFPPLIGYNFVYTYQPAYDQVLLAYRQTDGTAGLPVPAILMEQEYEATVSASTLRRVNLWALTSGASGTFYGHRDVWGVGDGAFANLTTTGLTQRKAIMDWFESLTGWQDLVPEADSSTLVTAGRGTRYRYSTDGAVANTDVLGAYVTAAKKPDGSMALIYMPNAASSITINTAQMGSSPTAKWVDPTTGAVTGTTFGSTYSRGTTNAAGDADWLLLLEASGGTATAVGTPARIGFGARSGAVTAAATVAGSAASLSLQSPSGVGVGQQAGTAVGSPARLSLQSGAGAATTAALGSAVGSTASMKMLGGLGAATAAAVTPGSVAQISLQAPGGTGLGGATIPGDATGSPAGLTLTARAGAVTVDAVSLGSPASLRLLAVSGSVPSTGTASGQPASMRVLARSGVGRGPVGEIVRRDLTITLREDNYRVRLR